MSWIGKYDNQKKTIITHREKHTEKLTDFYMSEYVLTLDHSVLLKELYCW